MIPFGQIYRVPVSPLFLITMERCGAHLVDRSISTPIKRFSLCHFFLNFKRLSPEFRSLGWEKIAIFPPKMINLEVKDHKHDISQYLFDSKPLLKQCRLYGKIIQQIVDLDFQCVYTSYSKYSMYGKNYFHLLIKIYQDSGIPIFNK